MNYLLIRMESHWIKGTAYVLQGNVIYVCQSQ